jgi:hypothetical protein
VFYREAAYPLRFGPSPGAVPGPVQFRGYALDAEGIPEFETGIGAITIRERATVVDGRFVRRFRITGTDIVWFSAPASAAGLEAEGGVRQGTFYRFGGPAAGEFTVSHPIPAASTALAVQGP